MGILFGPPGQKQRFPSLKSVGQFPPTDFKPDGPALEISLKHECFAGSSSTEGHQSPENNGILGQAPAWLIWFWKSEASTKTVKNFGVGGSTIDSCSDSQFGGAGAEPKGGSDISSAIGAGAIALGYSNENWTIQCDQNASGTSPWGDPGAADFHFSWLKGTGNYTSGGTHKGVFSGSNLASTVASEKRFVAWTFSDSSFGVLGGHGCFLSARFHRLAWAQYPGCAVDEPRYWQWVPPTTNDAAGVASERDGFTTTTHFQDDLNAKQFENMRLPSFQKAARDHMSHRGYALLTAMWIWDSIEARQGGFPWFPDHRYFVDNATARTNAGAVCTLGFQGDLAAFVSGGGSVSLIDLATGSVSPDFAINSSTAAVTRIGTGGTDRVKDLVVEVRKGDRVKWYHIEIGVSKGTAPKLSKVDGNFGVVVHSVANTGTTDAPIYAAKAACLTYAGVSNAASEGTFLFVLKPDADQDSNQLFLYAQAAAAGPLIQRTSTGFFRVSIHDHSGNALNQLTSTALVRNANGVRYCAYSFSITNARHQLVVYDDATGAIASSTGSLTPSVSATDGCLNPLSDGRVASLMGGSAAASINTFKGLWGPTWFADKEIDFIASSGANFAQFRAGAGTFVDLGASGAVTPSTGPNSGSSITPYVYFNGDACELTDGNNRGTGGQFESWQRRDWRQIDWTRGQPISQ